MKNYYSKYPHKKILSLKLQYDSLLNLNNTVKNSIKNN